MGKTTNPMLKLLASSVILAGGLLANSTAYAQSGGPPIICPDYKRGSTSIPGERTGKKIQKAFEAYSNDQVEEALTLLREIKTKQAFDRAYTDRFIGNLLAGKEGAGKEALEYLVRAVEPGVLNDGEQAITLRLVGDLNMQEKKYDEAIGWYEKWMDFTCKEDPDIYTRMAQAYYETKQLDKMIAPADKAIALYTKPNKNPYVLKMTSYYERKLYPQTVKMAETLVKLFPDSKQWWTQLGFFYMLVEDYKRALSTFEMAYIQGYLDQASQMKALAQLYGTNDMPYQAAIILEKYMKSGLLKTDAKSLASLANSWHQSRNYVKAAKYYGEAAKLSSDPEHYRKQGTLLLTAEKYNEAIKALDSALDAGTEKPVQYIWL